ncbi:putative phage tail protein [Levilactobacillus namurensis]|uniref:putative phage tail protein n=1 Tax=Levilactobacillus namurensis TaxID=380393 RepID=UPI000463A1FF|nr:putative phage tail protein [Levilactobacillus namurensis]
MSKLQDFKPNYYDGILEMDALLDAEQPAFDQATAAINRLLLNRFVMKADSDGLSLLESELGIETDLTQPLESRRYDILIRLLPPHPITFKYLKDLVKSFDISASLQRDVLKQTMISYSRQDSVTAEQLRRLRYLLNVYLPSNMDFQIKAVGDVAVPEILRMGMALDVHIETVVLPQPVKLGGS